MKLTIGKRAVSLGLCSGLAAMACAIGGVAIAAPSSSSSTIHACANNRTGVLSLANHCRAGSHAVTWNKTGPAGPSKVYATYIAAAQNLTPSAWTVVASLALPAGSYTVSAALEVNNGTTSSLLAQCQLNWPTGAGQAASSRFFGWVPTGFLHNGLPFNLIGQASLATPGTLTLSCDAGGTSSAGDIDVIATKVGSLS